MKTIKIFTSMKLILLLTSVFLISTFSMSQGIDDKHLVARNDKLNKEKVIGDYEKITVWIGDKKYVGKFTLIGDDHISIKDKKLALSDITEIRANTRKARIGGSVLIGIGALPVLFGATWVIIDGGNTIATPIGLAIMTLGGPPAITGSFIAFFKKKRVIIDGWALVIQEI
jgi:hypothetical protein